MRRLLGTAEEMMFSTCESRSHISAVGQGEYTDFGAFAETFEQFDVPRKLLILWG